MCAVQRRVRIGALPQEHDALDDIVVVDDPAVCSMDRLPVPAQPDLRALCHRRDIADPERGTVLRLDHRPLDVTDIGDEAQRQVRAVAGAIFQKPAEHLGILEG